MRPCGQKAGLAEALLEAADEGRRDGEALGDLRRGVPRLAHLVDAQPKVVAEWSHESSHPLPSFYARYTSLNSALRSFAASFAPSASSLSPFSCPHNIVQPSIHADGPFRYHSCF